MKRLLVLSLALLVHSEALGNEIVITTSMSSAELPAELRRYSYELEGNWERVALGLPAIRIDGGTLRIEEARGMSNRITTSRLIIRNGQIVTNGFDLTINALVLEVQGRGVIKSFDQVFGSGTAPTGQSGRSGLSGGNIALNVWDFRPEGRLSFDLSGTPGEAGGTGVPGSPGALGANGEPGRIKLNFRVDCSPPGNGGTGGRGGEGGPGGRGGNGGDGGSLVLGGILVKYRTAIAFKAEGGVGGAGGLGGSGGKGGRGGLAGRTEEPCPVAAKNGQDGPEGAQGPTGPAGDRGREGTIRADF